MFVNTEEISKITGLSKRMVYEFTATGKIPHIKSRGKFLYNPEKVTEALNRIADDSLSGVVTE